MSRDLNEKGRGEPRSFGPKHAAVCDKIGPEGLAPSPNEEQKLPKRPTSTSLQPVRPLAPRLQIYRYIMSLQPASCGTGASHVLIVDDDPFVRDVIAMILDGLGYSVTATGDGFEALRWLEEERYDLVISDLKMPGLDGPALYKEILARWPTGGPCVLFTSGFAETFRYTEATGTLDVPVLRKPFSVDALRDAVDRMLTPV